MPAQISLSGLLMSSMTHKEALVRILNEVKVLESISSNKLGLIVNYVFAMD